jgi:hypothetical protein
MRGDSLPGGSEMEFEARGLPARPHQPVQSEAESYQEPETESQSDFQQESESEPAQGGKKENVSL